MRSAALLLAISACAPKPLGVGPAATPIPVPMGPTDVLAVVHPGRAAFDTDTGRLFLAREQGVEVVDVRTGETQKRIDAPLASVDPAGPYLLAQHVAFPRVFVTVIDPLTRSKAAECTATLDVPKTAGAARLTAFGFANGAFLRWEATLPPSPPRGARMRDEEVAEWKRRFDEAYRCGVLAVRIAGGGCSLEPVEFAAAGLESCETRRLPPRIVMPAKWRDSALRVEETHEERWSQVHTLIVSDPTGAEVWRTEVSRRHVPPPPP